MVRIRKAFNVKTEEFMDYLGYQFINGRVLSERELLVPIPTDEIRNNESFTQKIGDTNE